MPQVFFSTIMLKYIAFFILLMLVPDFYIWRTFTRHCTSVWPTVLVVLPTLLALLLMLYSAVCPSAMWAFKAFFMILVCIAVPKLLFLLVAIVGEGAGWLIPAARGILLKGAVAVGVMAFGVQVFGSVWGWQRLGVNHVGIRVDRLPEGFEGYRIVQLSDIHLGTYGHDDRLMQRMVDSVNALHPDLIVFTGDIVNTSPEELPPFRNALSRLKARDGILSILGNHDYCIYGVNMTDAERERNVRRIVDFERGLGWQVLLNEHATLHRGTDSLCIAGVENTGRPPFPSRGKVSQALQGINPGTCTLMLSHDPWHWHHGLVGQTDVALTLSGHTHAMQFRIGHFSPAQWVAKEWGGLYADGRQKLYVSTGIGGTVGYRLGAWPSIECITLKK